jgi:hypothetical protein
MTTSRETFKGAMMTIQNRNPDVVPVLEPVLAYELWQACDAHWRELLGSEALHLKVAFALIDAKNKNEASFNNLAKVALEKISKEMGGVG